MLFNSNLQILRVSETDLQAKPTNTQFQKRTGGNRVKEASEPKRGSLQENEYFHKEECTNINAKLFKNLLRRHGVIYKSFTSSDLAMHKECINII